MLRVIGVALVVKLIEKGARAEKEGYLADYNARKANIEAAEKAMWDEELAAHAVDTAVAEAAVLRQRTLDWKNRQDFQAHSDAMERMHFPFNAKMA